MPIDLVYLDLGGTVVELISYEGVAVDPAPQTEHLGYRMTAIIGGSDDNGDVGAAWVRLAWCVIGT